MPDEQWLRGEAPLKEMLEDPIVRLVMRRDGVDKRAVESVFMAANTRKKGEPKGHGQAIS